MNILEKKNNKRLYLWLLSKKLIQGLHEAFGFIYKNIEILSFEEEPPYNHFITLIEKEKAKILQKII